MISFLGQPGQSTEEVALTRLTITPPPTKYPLIAMPAVNLGVTSFEVPENAVRVLLTGYGVSLAITNLLNICLTHCYRMG